MGKKRRAVFVGNCQLAMLKEVYAFATLEDVDTIVHYVPSHEPLTPETKRLIRGADLLVRQVLDFVPKIGAVETRGVCHDVPHVAAGFLWPLHGQPHPRNAAVPFGDANGPYPGEFGDTLLNRFIRERRDPEEAVAQFMVTDVATLRRVDRLLEMSLGLQQARDAATGYAFAGLIEQRFREERLFRSANHPENALSRAFATEVFTRVGLEAAHMERLRAYPDAMFFPKTEAPIHPSVIRHFGLAYVDADTRYEYFDEGGYTTAEFAGRYLRYEYDAKLAEGLHLARAGENEAAIVALTTALATTPGSRVGRAELDRLLVLTGRVVAAPAPRTRAPARRKRAASGV